jgi:hypothetical protein
MAGGQPPRRDGATGTKLSRKRRVNLQVRRDCTETLAGRARLECLEDPMKKSLAFVPLALLVAAAVADVPGAGQDARKQPRTLGQKAVLHIYYYAPKTLEITYVDSYLFKDEDACRNAISAALQIAMPFAGEGDLVSAKCVGMNPPEAITPPDNPRDGTAL